MDNIVLPVLLNLTIMDGENMTSYKNSSDMQGTVHLFVLYNYT